MSYQLRGMGDLATFAPGGLVCASDEQITPYKAWVNSPDDPDYLAASNWHCVKKSQMALASGFTFSAGLKAWVNPLMAMATIPAAVGDFSNHPQFSAGVLLPIAAVATWFMFGRGGGSPRRYGR